MRINRRAFVGSVLTQPLLLPFLPSVGSAAVDPVTAGVIMTAASNAISLLKRSGDLELSIQALNVKLDRILENQLLLLQAIRVVSDQLVVIQKTLDRLPAEDWAFQEQIRANTTWQGIGANAAILETRPSDTSARANLLRHHAELVTLSRALRAGVGQRHRPLNVAFANKHLLLGIALLLRLQKNRRLEIWSATELGLTLEAARNAEAVAVAMVDKNGIQIQVNELQPALDSAVKGIQSNYLSRLIPKEFSIPVRGKEGGDEQIEQSTSTVEFVSPASTVTLKRYPGSPSFDPVIGYSPSGQDVRITRSINQIAFITYCAYAFGGRRLMLADFIRTKDGKPDTKIWKERGWIQHEYQEGRNAYPKEGARYDSASLYAGLLEVGDAAAGAPSVLGPLQTLLKKYNAIVEEESYLLAVRKMSSEDILFSASLITKLQELQTKR